ncbi:MAG: DNA-3-methyladenine glycosylase 2 family protein [Thiohalomonadales bacterium]
MQSKIEDAYYNAILTRDAKFDGKFFSAVKTTGIYCRPICPAKPKRVNVEFFSSALLAEKAGYRPCLRCRPESAPDSPRWHGKNSVVSRAVQVLFNDESAIELNEKEFAARFEMSARHLRRLFLDELGRTPMQIKRNHRLNLARKLIIETHLAFIDIAFSVGFDSVRRFNDAIRERFSKTPTELRRRIKQKPYSDLIEFNVCYRPPLDWQASLDYYQKHKIGDLEEFKDGCYQRIFRFENETGIVRVHNNEKKHRLDISLQTSNVNALNYVLCRIKEMFDLSLDPVYITSAFESQPGLHRFYESRHGVRLARCWDRFELAISTILGQLISVKHATQLTNELMELYGEQHEHPITSKQIRFFPCPEKLASENLAALKVTRAKKMAIITLAQHVFRGEIHFSSYQDPKKFKHNLLKIHGIGPWTAEYIALRAIGDTDAFPEGDVYLDKILGTTNIDKLTPWRGYLATILYKYGGKT